MLSTPGSFGRVALGIFNSKNVIKFFTILFVDSDHASYELSHHFTL